MSEDGYPLESVLTVRRRAVEAARLGLAQAIGRFEAAAAAVREAAAEVQGKGDELDQRRTLMHHNGASVGQLQRHQSHADGLQAELHSLQQQCARLQADERDGGEAVARARDELAALQVELEATEKHRDRWTQQRRLQRERSHEDDLDDVVRATRAENGEG